MKNLMSLIALLLSFTFATAQNTEFTIGMDAIGLYTELNDANGDVGITLGMESAMGKRFTISVNRTMAKTRMLEMEGLIVKRKMNALNTGIKFYPRVGQRGFFIGLDLGFTSVKYKIETNLLPELSSYFGGLPEAYLGGGMSMGFKASITEKLTLGTHAGLKLMTATDFENAGLQYNIGAKLGYKF